MLTSSLVRDITSLKIQGAAAIAKSALYHLVEKSSKATYQELCRIRTLLEKSRPTEPFLRNALMYSFTKTSTPQEVGKRASLALKKLLADEEKLSLYASRKVPRRGTVCTLCHSSAVVLSLHKAKKNRISFEVRCMETRPLFQGRKTAKELVGFRIPTTLYVDSAARVALSKADVCFLGADSIESEGSIINKIGSGMVGSLAKELGVPLYIVTHSWKFNAQTQLGSTDTIEKRSREEVWDGAPKNLKIFTGAFERLRAPYITGIITELGIYPPAVFVEEVCHYYPWMRPS